MFCRIQYIRLYVYVYIYAYLYIRYLHRGDWKRGLCPFTVPASGHMIYSVKFRRSLVIYAYIHLDNYLHVILYLFQNVNVKPRFFVETGEQNVPRGLPCRGLLPRNSTQIVITWVLPQASTAVIQHRRRVQICQFFLGWDKMEGEK